MQENETFGSLGATTFLGPVPAVLVGCAQDDGWTRGEGKAPNLLTIAWAGICCSKPPMLGIAVRPERYSHKLIVETGEFTVNLVGKSLCRAMDFCGVKSGRDVNKFTALGLTPVAAPPLAVAPALLEAPAYLCCRVRQVVPLGSHDLFLAEIEDARVRREFLRQDGSVDEKAMELVGYVHGKYYAAGPEIGFFGYSVAAKAVLERRIPEAGRKDAATVKEKAQSRKPAR
jgi:flavin reductase (DIM6/NTAB) family NADH-FMN oxidoreductase RutF